MASKVLNREIVHKAVTEEFWRLEPGEVFAPDFQIDFPNAAPGIPQHLDEFEVERYFFWLQETVKTWNVQLHQLYGTPDPDVFWAVSTVSACVHWGGQDGNFETRRFARYELKDGKIRLLVELSNPLRWLEAAGREIPVFRMDLEHPRVNAALAEKQQAKHLSGRKAQDMSDEAVQARTAGGIRAFMSGDYWRAVTEIASYAPELDAKVWFLPPEMKESYPPEMAERVEIWSQLSCPYIEFDRMGRVWETDDPHVFFCEYRCFGITDWLGNNTPNSRYRNRYVYVLHFDDAGQICCCEEVLNPINKYNSVNISLPSFPYYF